MRAVLINAEWELERRRELGLDKKDELWDGEWHFVNPPKRWHERLNFDMALVLGPRARDLGLEPYAGAGLIADITSNFRVPDQVYARADDGIDDGVTAAELVVEVRSPGDESYLKVPFFAERVFARSSSSTATGTSTSTGSWRASTSRSPTAGASHSA